MGLKTKMNECYSCQHKRNVPCSAYVRCVKPDPKMVGVGWGKVNGWFDYPLLFDPVWKDLDCSNFKQKSE
jgi:hypothetical protein